ncbi:STM3941 family protein [Mucilaginibacter celer]|uniref:Uncharacterized protein n=1 Tax=Mucilaginibacter celer TaxID=2305508 RepID=A0A494W048_9SPHI|nr:STM3941 family protein [Mucilaginibacter celer]AYL96825.1 hypothetical protein HYN43_016620 [Mucilaginibacter celer]
MTAHPPIQIPLNKTKITKGLLGSVAFVAISAWILIKQPHIGNPMFDNVLVKYGVTSLGIVFFGFTAFFFLKKMGDKKPGLVIDDEGIFDNTGATSVGLIPWQDISGVGISSLMNQQFLIIGVKNPEQYIEAQTNLLRKKSFGFNYKNYGSPIAISANTINYNLGLLAAELNGRLNSDDGEV